MELMGGVVGGRIHSARTMSLALIYSSKESFLSCVTSDAEASAAAARRLKTAFLKEGIVVFGTYGKER